MKKHYFLNCPNFSLFQNISERSIVNDISEITCGQCKNKILNIISKYDWSELDQNLIIILNDIAKKLK
jgi:hypothetical protein